MYLATEMAGFAADAQLAGTRALLVDDDPDLVEMLGYLLTAFGIEVVTASSGDEAYARFVERPPDIVISDVHMPGGSGFDLVRRIRALPPERGGLTPAIAISGAADLDETFDAGFHYYLGKPLRAQALIDAVRAFVRDDGSATHGSWSVGVDADAVTVRLEGPLSGHDMRALIDALVPILETSKAGCHIVADLRRLGGFSPAVGAIGELGLWRVREKIRSLLVVGGSALARTVSRSACALLGISLTFSDALPA